MAAGHKMRPKFTTVNGNEYALVLYGALGMSGVVLDDRGQPVRHGVAGILTIASGTDSTVAALRRLGYLVEDQRPKPTLAATCTFLVGGMVAPMSSGRRREPRTARRLFASSETKRPGRSTWARAVG